MTRFATPTQPVTSFFLASFFAITLLFAGCSAATISGPDLAPPDETTMQAAPPSDGQNAVHNEGNEGKTNGNGTAAGGGGDRHGQDTGKPRN